MPKENFTQRQSVERITAAATWHLFQGCLFNKEYGKIIPILALYIIFLYPLLSSRNHAYCSLQTAVNGSGVVLGFGVSG